MQSSPILSIYGLKRPRKKEYAEARKRKRANGERAKGSARRNANAATRRGVPWKRYTYT